MCTCTYTGMNADDATGELTNDGRHVQGYYYYYYYGRRLLGHASRSLSSVADAVAGAHGRRLKQPISIAYPVSCTLSCTKLHWGQRYTAVFGCQLSQYWHNVACNGNQCNSA